MPAEKVPRQLGSHRQAAIALFRALLTQCRSAPLEPQQRESLASIVRNRFHTPRPQRLRLALAFQSGYAALDLLDASVAGDSSSTQRIQELISKTPVRLHQPPKPRVAKIRLKDPAQDEPPPEHKFLNVFPRPHVEGIRRVPYLVDAGGFPFIRYKKPQPENVSRVIRQKIVQKQKHWNYIHKLDEHLVPLAEQEDRWDAFLKQETGQSLEGVEDHSSFLAEMKAEKQNMRERMTADGQKLVRRIELMTNIILEEKRLAAKERDERRRLSKERRDAQKVNEDASQVP